MPDVKIDDTLTMHYAFDSFAEPWRTPEAILLVHGVGGCAEEWYAWVPPLSGKYAVVRVDLRGWGKSTVPPADYPWSMDNFARDLKVFMDKVGLTKVHIVGTKLGGRIALHFARAYPDRLHSMTLVCTPMTISHRANDSREQRPTLAGGRASVEHWARSTMYKRLGDVPPDMMEWWNELYSNSVPSVISGVFDAAWDSDEFDLLDDIAVETLVIDASSNRDIEEIVGWQRKIKGSKLVIIPTTKEGKQISAVKPLECVAALTHFLDQMA